MIQQFSPNEMRFRGDNLNRDYREKMQEVGVQRKLSKALLEFGYAPLRYIDHVISSSLWLAAYRDAMKVHAALPQEQAHSKAVHTADAAVRMGIGTSTPGDLPPIMRSEEYWKMITTLYGFENVNLNIARLEMHKFGQTGNLPRLSYAMAMGLMIPGLLSPLITGDRPKEGENPVWWAAKQEWSYSLGLFPGLRDVDRGDVALDFLKQGYRTVGDVHDLLESKTSKDWVDAMIEALQTAGQVKGVVGTAEATRIMRYMHRAREGKIENPNAWNAIVGGR